MIPFFFGAADRQLFGIYEPAREPSLGRGVVMCHPWGQEYLRCHQSLRFLARLLANAGVHVLRFDYFGTGDSTGELEEATIEQWIEDTQLAVSELQAMGNVSRVSLVGLRLGALVAAEASRRLQTVERLVLWDPVGGRRYLQELSVIATSKDRRGEPPFVVEGFPMTADMARGIATLDPTRLGPELPATYVALSAAARPQPSAALAALVAAGVPHETAPYEGPVIWNDSGELGTAGMPVKALRGMLGWLTA